MVSGVQIVEGGTKLLVPENHSSGGPGKILDTVFFNEQMAFNRDISVMFLRALGRHMTVADAMTATGARAVRIANEVPDTEVTANDIYTTAVEYVKANIELNGLTNCTASHQNLHSLLTSNVFDYVDLDPFGSPVPFLDSAILGCRRHGILAVTATDAAPLSGAHKEKCIRRYQAVPLRGPMCHEAGIRLLVGYVARELAKFDIGMSPLLCFSSDHYYRAYVRLENGAGNADETLKKMTYLAYDPVSMSRSASPTPDRDHRYGPFWGGRLFDRDILGKMCSEGMAVPKRCEQMLSTWRQEIDDVPFMYDMSELSSMLKVSTPRFEDFLTALSEKGRVSRTHISPTTFKTDLPLETICAVFRGISPSNKQN
jgi:tRNA (guanine26-N2/guanine27-N2)-dimethyltransferase